MIPISPQIQTRWKNTPLMITCAENDPSTHLPTGREERSVAGVPRHSEMPEKFARWLEIFHVMDTKADVFAR